MQLSLSFPRFWMPREMLPRTPASAEPFVRYWRIYGGWRALATSPYLVAALALTGVCYPFWSKPGTASADLAVSVVPSIMASSLGGMAIILAFSGGPFLNVIRQGRDKSLFMTVIANFFHFLTVQTMALVAAMVVLAFPLYKEPSGIAFFFLAYSITTGLASAAALFNMSRIYNEVGDDDKPS